MTTSFDFLASANRTITLEADAVSNLKKHLQASFNVACELMYSCQGRVIVTGMGKSGHIGKKIDSINLVNYVNNILVTSCKLVDSCLIWSLLPLLLVL